MYAEAKGIADFHGVSVQEVMQLNAEYQKLSETYKLMMWAGNGAGFRDDLEEATGAAEELEDELEEVEEELEETEKKTNGFGRAITKAMKSLGKMALAIFGVRGAYRAMRMAVTEYLYTNEYLAGQIETLKSTFAQVLGPAIEYVVNLLIKAVSAVNAFVVALGGINIVAKANAAALKKQASAGGGLNTASFDEQTTLGSGGSSKSGVGKLPDGSSIDLSFLEPLMDAIRKFKEDIAPLLKTVGDLFKWVWSDVLTPFGEWLANGLLVGALDVLGEVCIVLNNALLKLKPIAKWIWDNVLEPVAKWTGGAIVDILSVIGSWISEHSDTLGTVAAVVGVIVGVVVGIPAVLGAVGTALAFLFNPVTLIVTVITGLVAGFVTLYDECEGFRAGMDQVWQGLKDIFSAGIDFVKALFAGDWAGLDAAWERIKESAAFLWEGLVDGLTAGYEWAKERIVALWNKIVEKFKEIFGIHSPSKLFEDFGGFMMDGLVNGLKNAINKVTNACKQIWSAIKDVFSSVGTWFKDTFSKAWQKVKDVFSTGGKIYSGIKEGITSTFKTIVNGLITGINTIIATPFNAINKMLNTIRSIDIMGSKPFSGLWSYNPLTVPQIPKLAVGGIVNRPGRGVPAIIGEAGAEAVLPLENHTEWMDILADKIGGNVTIPIYMDGKKIATYVVDIQKKKAFAMNGV